MLNLFQILQIDVRRIWLVSFKHHKSMFEFVFKIGDISIYKTYVVKFVEFLASLNLN